MSNRYTQITPGKFNPLSLNEIMMAPLTKQKQHENQQTQMAEMGMFDVNRLTVDDELIGGDVNRMKQDVQDIEDQLMNTGVSSGLSKRLMKAKADRTNYLGTEGAGGKAQAAYNAYQANADEVRKMYQKGDISAGKYQAGLQKALAGYEGVAADGTYTPFTATADTDYEGKAREVAVQISKNPSVLQKILPLKLTDDGSMYINTETEETYTPKDAIKLGIRTALANDSNIMNDLMQREQLGLFGGRTSIEVIESLSDNYEALFGANEWKEHQTLIGNRGYDTSTGTTNGGEGGIVSHTGEQHFYAKEYGTYEKLREASNSGDPQAVHDLKRFKNTFKNSSDFQSAKLIKDGRVRSSLELTDDGEALYGNEESMASLVKSLSSGDEIKDNKTIGKWYKYKKDHTAEDNNRGVKLSEGQIWFLDAPKMKAAGWGADAIAKIQREFDGSDIDYLKKDRPTLFKDGWITDIGKMKNPERINEVQDNIDAKYDEAFSKGTASQVFRYTPDNVKPAVQNAFNGRIKNYMSIGNTNDYEILSVNSQIDGEPSDIDDDFLNEDKDLTTSNYIFSKMKAANDKDFKVLSVQQNPFSNTPSMTVDFKVDGEDGMETYSVEIGLDKTRNYDNIKSGESAAIEFLEQNGGSEGARIGEDMRHSIEYKDVRANSNKADFTKTNDFKQKILSPRLNKKFTSEFGNDYKLNVYSQSEGIGSKYAATVKGEDGQIKNLTWKDAFNEEDLDFTTPKTGAAFDRQVALIGYALDNNLIGQEELSNEKLLTEALTEIATSPHYPLLVEDRYELFNLLSK